MCKRLSIVWVMGYLYVVLKQLMEEISKFHRKFHESLSEQQFTELLLSFMQHD
jgi:hypothetical protein